MGNADDWPGYLYGAEYEINAAYPRNTHLLLKTNNNGRSIDNEDVPCVFCKVSGRSVVSTFAAATRCPAGWDLEYKGYLMATFHAHNGRAGPVCMDEAPEVISSGRGRGEQQGTEFLFVQSKCAPLPCPPYVDGRQLACVVCSL